MLVDRPHTDRAAARQGDARGAVAGDQRTQHQHRGAHGRDQLVRRQIAGHVLDGDGDLAAATSDRGAVGLEQLQHRADVTQVGDVRERQRARGQQRGGQRGQRCIFGGAGRHFTPEWYAALDEQTSRHQRSS
jgi:hypothetical protein